MDQYTKAGVNIDKGDKFAKSIVPIVQKTYSQAVLAGVGGFSGLFSLNITQYYHPVLVSSTDGVGTKLKIAFMMGKHDTVGIDLVAMCINDIVVYGAQPLYMLDYISMGKLELDIAESLIRGIVEGCYQAQCSLIGGETAEMPGFYYAGEYDLVGFAVGIVDNDKIINGSAITGGNVIIGLASSGLHSNGYSLVRYILFEKFNFRINMYVDELRHTIGEELLIPARIYSDLVLTIYNKFQLFGVVHITGGGILENIPRILPNFCQAVIYKNSWLMPPIFSFLQKIAKIHEREMYRTFNCGIGMCLIVSPDDVDNIINLLKSMGQLAFLIGEVKFRDINQPSVVLSN